MGSVEENQNLAMVMPYSLDTNLSSLDTNPSLLDTNLRSAAQGEWVGRRFGSWAEVDDLKRVVVKEKVDGKEVSRDLAVDFFGRLRSC
ncbi:hypothetical protein EV426DRAFT_715079 [Tirmania nivea]|nr:hypothetical protein EV426DRAFT_715079 [Tirmania nivea]